LLAGHEIGEAVLDVDRLGRGLPGLDQLDQLDRDLNVHDAVIFEVLSPRAPDPQTHLVGVLLDAALDAGLLADLLVVALVEAEALAPSFELVLADELAVDLPGLEQAEVLVLLVGEQEASHHEAVADAGGGLVVEQKFQQRQIVADDVVAPDFLGFVEEIERLVDRVFALVLAELPHLTGVEILHDDAVTDGHLVEETVCFCVEDKPAVFLGLEPQERCPSESSGAKVGVSET
jgi:hypothetical protein